MNFFEPDVVVESKPGLAASVGWDAKENYQREMRLVTLAEFAVSDSYGRLRLAAGLNVAHVFQDLYEREFKFQSRDPIKFLVLSKSSRFSEMEAIVGAFPADDIFSSVRASYAEAFSPEICESSTETLRRVFAGEFRTPRWSTRSGLEVKYKSPREPVIFVFDPTDSEDLIDLWNLRQFAPWVFPIPINWLEEMRAWIIEFISLNSRPVPESSPGYRTVITIEFARSIRKSARAELVSHLDPNVPENSYSTKDWYDDISQASPARRGRDLSRIQIHAASRSFDEPIKESESLRGKDMRVRVPKLSPTFINREFYDKRTWANVISVSPPIWNDQIATIYPPNFLLPSLPNFRWGEVSTVTSEGWVLPQTIETDFDSLHLETGRDALTQWLKGKGIEATPSDAGRVAEQIIRAAGDLHACAMFANPEVVKLLNESASGKEDKAIPTQRWENVLKPKNTWQMPWINLQRFLDSQILRAGLEVKCPNCAQLNWYDLRALDYEIVCNRLT